MTRTRLVLALLLGIGCIGSHSDAYAKDHYVTMKAVEVSGIDANCAIPDNFVLKYATHQHKKRVTLRGKSARIMRGHAVVTRRVVDKAENLGREITVAFNRKSKQVEVVETVVALDNSGSCKFKFRA
jgi:hypothetical protein